MTKARLEYLGMWADSGREFGMEKKTDSKLVAQGLAGTASGA
jgi:hypothetical protein